jgi:hypothetical protein
MPSVNRLLQEHNNRALNISSLTGMGDNERGIETDDLPMFEVRIVIFLQQ